MAKNPEKDGIVFKVVDFLKDEAEKSFADSPGKAKEPDAHQLPSGAPSALDDDRPSLGRVVAEQEHRRRPPRSAAKFKLLQPNIGRVVAHDFWQRLFGRLKKTTEKAIEAQLQAGDECVQTADGEYVIGFAEADPAEAQRRTDTILRDVRADIDRAGEGADAISIQGEVIDGTADLDLAAKAAPRAIAVSDDRMRRGARPPAATAPFGTIAMTFRPVWNPQSAAVACYLGAPVRHVGAQFLQGEAAYASLHDQDAAVTIDLLVAKACAQAAAHMVESASPALVVAPLRYRSLAGKRRREILEILRNIPANLRAFVIVDVVSVPAELGKSVVATAIQEFRGSCRMVGARIDLDRLNLHTVTDLHLSMVGCDLTGVTHDAQVAAANQFGQFRKKAKAAGLKTYVWGADDPQCFRLAIEAGISMISGSPMGEPVASPVGIYKAQPKL